jgi:hypothetical protein
LQTPQKMSCLNGKKFITISKLVFAPRKKTTSFYKEACQKNEFVMEILLEITKEIGS